MACGSPAIIDTADSSTPDAAPEPYIEIDTPVEPAWNPDELEEVLEAALATGIPDVLTLREHYRDFMLRGQTDCPLYENQNHESWVGVWASECTTDDGTEFFGTALYQEYHSDVAEEGEEYRFDMGMVASFELTDPDGSVFVGGGGFILTRGPMEYGVSWSVQL